MSRSLHGCWTCRLRKKKCDESRPSCFKCSSLQIDCHGYGPRPYWMDRGALQREEALKLKQIISRIRFNLRQQEEPGTIEHVEIRLNDLVTGNRTLRHLVSEPAKSTPSQSTPSFEDNHSSFGIGVDLATSAKWMHIKPLDCVAFTSEPCFERTLGVNTCGCKRCSSKTSRNAINWDWFLEHERISRGYVNPLTQCGQPNVPNETILSLYEPVLTSTHYNNQTSWLDEQLTGENAWLASQKKSFSASGSQTSQLDGLDHRATVVDTEDDLLMYYLDRVFYFHCPFYSSTTLHRRGWLLSILKRKRSAYHAALSLSEYHQARSSQQARSQLLQGRGKHYNIALRELQLCIGSFRAGNGNLCLEHNIEVLTSILHLLFYESMNGGKKHWQMHLRAANAFIPALVQAQITPIEEGIQYTQDHPDTVTSNSMIRLATGFLLGFLVYIDIISCASTRSSPILSLDHELILTRGKIDLHTLIGCDNWAMVFIFEISRLDKWQEEENKARKLSLLELTNRGREIEGRLKRRLADGDNILSCSGMRGDVDDSYVSRASTTTPRTTTSSPTALPDHTCRPGRRSTTWILALSAMTYLHVVISGAYPEIPEIKDSVSKTIDALQNLPDPKLLRYVTWSFCVSGCLAVDGQQHIIRELASSPHIGQSGLEAFEIVKECWHLRKTGRFDCDWARVMRQMGEHILFV